MGAQFVMKDDDENDNSSVDKEVQGVFSTALAVLFTLVDSGIDT